MAKGYHHRESAEYRRHKTRLVRQARKRHDAWLADPVAQAEHAVAQEEHRRTARLKVIESRRSWLRVNGETVCKLARGMRSARERGSDRLAEIYPARIHEELRFRRALWQEFRSLTA
jgi:hypothetical protein